MKSLIRLLPALAFIPAIGFAQTLSVKPGLWENKVVMKSESGRLETMLEAARVQIAAMPAAQRQMMESMMAGQGLKLDLDNQSFQNCVTEEDATQGEFKFSQESGCEQSNIRNEGSLTRISFSCAQSQGEIVFTGDSEYSGTSVTTMTLEGRSEAITATHNGRWLGASCDALK